MDTPSPLAGWFGGKRFLAKKIIAMMPEHVCYCEPFCGAAWVYFRKGPVGIEVLNDRSGDVVNLFRVIRDQPDALQHYARFALHAREEFDYWRKYDGHDPVKRAWRLLFVLRTCFGGRISSGLERASFGYEKYTDNAKARTGRCVAALGRRIALIHARLAETTIECLDWRDCLARYDRATTFFYLDPPYYGYEDQYGRGLFQRADLADLAAALEQVRGRFILSINDLPQTREIFRDFVAMPVQARYSVCRNGQKSKTELLIANYELQGRLGGGRNFDHRVPLKTFSPARQRQGN